LAAIIKNILPAKIHRRIIVNTPSGTNDEQAIYKCPETPNVTGYD